MQKKELIEFLAMKHVEKHKKYLGIPTIAGRSKKFIFSEISDRIWKKLQGWKGSRTGKEVLLKAVFQAIPS